MKKYAFGVDIGGTTCKIGFFETAGVLLDKWEIHTNTENGGVNILPDVAKAIDNKLAQEGVSKSEVQGVGVGVPGPVTSGGIVNRCVNLGWGVINVAEELGKLTGCNGLVFPNNLGKLCFSRSHSNISHRYHSILHHVVRLYSTRCRTNCQHEVN